MNIYNKYEKLKNLVKDMKKVVIAFSGGVDSTFLIKVAYDILKDHAVAVTITSPYHPDWERQEAKELAEKIGIQQIFIQKELNNKELIMNPKDRCYLCKKDVFKEILDYARKNRYPYVLDGSNYDDTFDYRPGMKALKELDIKSPLLEVGLTKDEIRKLSKDLGLSTWNKPPYACLLTRIPYHQEIKVDDLKRIEKAETYLINLGFRQVRVRIHDSLARIEIGRSELQNIFNLELMDQINKEFKKIGFQYITLDLEGYKMGSFNNV